MNASVKEYGGFEREKFFPILEYAKKDPLILAVIVFGSYAREEDYRDIDVCLFLYPDYKDKIENEARYKLNTTLSLPTSSEEFDIAFFDDLPLYIKARVLKDSKILLNKDYDTLFDIFEKTIKDYNMYESHLDILLGEK